MTPIYVCANTWREAVGFIETDMRDDPRRLRFVDRPDQLRGQQGVLLYMHPSAPAARRYDEIMIVARAQGCILVHMDYTYQRARASKQ
jgi:hypothetical protein